MKRKEAVVGRWPQLTGRKTDPVFLFQSPAPAPQNRCGAPEGLGQGGGGGEGIKSGSWRKQAKEDQSATGLGGCQRLMARGQVWSEGGAQIAPGVWAGGQGT